MERQQGWLFTSLDELVPRDHVIRMVDAALAPMDWSKWEMEYSSDRRGQPPIHPSRVAGCIIYGLTRKVRSSRELEEATRERLDFRWFMEGRTVDHCTFAEFRTRFNEPLKELSRAMVRRICEAHQGALEMLVMDGTRLRANSDRHGARTAEGLQRLIERCTEVLHERLEKMEAADAQDGAESEAAQLRAEIERLKAQIAQYTAAAQVAETRDQERREKLGSDARPVSVPVTDPDSTIVPNKEGGFAPNYSPVVAVDAATGAIVSAEVPEGADESSMVMAAVDEAERLGAAPKRMMADGGFGNGENLEHLADRGIETIIPTGTDFRETNPANRPDPTAAVPEEKWDSLPMAGKKLRASAFIYNAEHDEYRCPMGKPLTRQRGGQRRQGSRYISYACAQCKGCPLAGRCLSKGSSARTVSRDEYQDLRDHVGRGMATDEGIALYKKRAPLVETVFAHLKGGMGIRGFLLRGLAKVRTEWTWICCAYNLKILLRAIKAGRNPARTSPLPAHGTKTSPSLAHGATTRNKFHNQIRYTPCAMQHAA
jgi:transposase